jgi:hypothetical protein
VAAIAADDGFDGVIAGSRRRVPVAFFEHFRVRVRPSVSPSMYVEVIQSGFTASSFGPVLCYGLVICVAKAASSGRLRLMLSSYSSPYCSVDGRCAAEVGEGA